MAKTTILMYQLEVERLHDILKEKDNQIESLKKEHSEERIIDNRIKLSLKEEIEKAKQQFKDYIIESNKEKLELVNRILELEGQAYIDMPDYKEEGETWMEECSNAFYNMKEDELDEASNN